MGMDRMSTIRVHSELRGLSTMKFAFQAPFCLCTYHQEKYSKLTIRAFLKVYLRIKILAVELQVELGLMFSDKE